MLPTTSTATSAITAEAKTNPVNAKSNLPSFADKVRGAKTRSLMLGNNGTIAST